MSPTILYKYTSQSTAEVILHSGRLRWSSPTAFNDLAEFQRMPRFEPTVSEAHRLLPEALIAAAAGRILLDIARLAPNTALALKLITNLMRNGTPESQLFDIFKNFHNSGADDDVEHGLRVHFESLNPDLARVLCLTSSFNNDVMWGTYAESHFGCVLGFTASLDDSPFHEAKPVIYSENIPVAGSGVDFLLYGASSELRKKTIEAVFYTKKSVWSYEQEWRLITWRPRETATYGDYIFHPQELESVTFGARVKSDAIKSLSEVIKKTYPDTPLFQMAHAKGELCRRAVA